MPKATKKLKAAAPASNVFLFPVDKAIETITKIKNVIGCAPFDGDLLENEFGICDGDLLLIRNDLPLIAISPDMLCLVDHNDGRRHIRKIIAHNTQDFTVVHPSDGDEVRTSLSETSIVGVVVGWQRSIDYGVFLS